MVGTIIWSKAGSNQWVGKCKHALTGLASLLFKEAVWFSCTKVMLCFYAFSACNIKILKFWTPYPKICCNHPKIWTRWLFLKVMHPKDAESCKQCRPRSDCSSRSSLIWVCTVCPDLSVRTLRNITVNVNCCWNMQEFSKSQSHEN